MEKNKLIMECMKDLVKSLGKASIVVDIAKIIAICGYHPKKKQDERKS